MKKTRKSIILVTLILILSLVLAACSQPSNTSNDKKDTAKESITIAVTGPLSGDYTQYGEAFRKGTALKVKEINENGGIDGKEVKILLMDDKNDPKEAANVAQRLVEDKSVVGVIGHFSSTASLATAPIYQKAGLVEFSPTASHPDFTKQGSYMFRNINTQSIEGPIVADMVVNRMKGKKIAVVYINNDWGITAKDNFTSAAKALGAEIVAEETFIGGQTKDFTPTLTKINEKKPDVLFLAAFYSETGMIAQQMKQLGYDIPMAGLSSLYNEELIKLAGDAVEGLYLSTNFFPGDTNPLVQDFITNFKADYSGDPDQFAAVAYDTMGMMIEAIKTAGTDRTAIRDTLAQMKDYPGVTGDTTFNENRDVVKTLKVLQIKDGKFTIVE